MIKQIKNLVKFNRRFLNFEGKKDDQEDGEKKGFGGGGFGGGGFGGGERKSGGFGGGGGDSDGERRGGGKK